MPIMMYRFLVGVALAALVIPSVPALESESGVRKEVRRYVHQIKDVILGSTSGKAAAPLVIGVAFGVDYQGDDIHGHLSDLKVQSAHMNVFWGHVQPTPDAAYDFSMIDAFLNNLPEGVAPLLRISARRSGWGTHGEHRSVPNDLAVGAPYYNFVNAVVAHTKHRVSAYENEWEGDLATHWDGTPREYAQMVRTFYRAVKDAHPGKLVIMGGSAGSASEASLRFFTEVFAELADDSPPPFEMFDLHLYGHLYDIPDRVAAYRAIVGDTPLVVTEYGGPSPEEFYHVSPHEYRALREQVIKNPCSRATDFSCLPYRSQTCHSYPDELRMFAYGLDPAGWLDAKRDRIQSRQMVQRTLLALSSGVKGVYWWNLTSRRSERSLLLGCDFRHPIFGKMQLTRPQADPDGPLLLRKPVFSAFRNMVSWLDGPLSVQRLAHPDPDLFLFHVQRGDGANVFIVWQKRDQYHGEEAPPSRLTLDLPWVVPYVAVSDIFGNEKSLATKDGRLTLELADTPILVRQP